LFLGSKVAARAFWSHNYSCTKVSASVSSDLSCPRAIIGRQRQGSEAHFLNIIDPSEWTLLALVSVYQERMLTHLPQRANIFFSGLRIKVLSVTLSQK
jgi:hypothetical protein